MSVNFPIRVLIAILAFLGVMVSYMLRVNFNIAIVTMTDSDDVDIECKNQSSDHQFETGQGQTRFCWSETDKGWVKGAFFYGYVVLQVAGGSLAERIGTKMVLGPAMAFCGVITLITPILAKANMWLLFASRLLIGFAEGVTYPCLYPLFMRWVPEQEKGKFVSFVFLGGSFGTVVTFPICGYILEALDWEAVFYITGSIAVLWFVLWFLLTTDEPSSHKWISKREVNFIEEFRAGKTNANITPPYLEILMSPAVWVIILAEFANSWGLFMILTEGPNFISEVLDQDITKNGILNALPSLIAVILGQLSGILADWLLVRNYLSKPNLRRIWVSLSLGVPAICVTLMGYLTEDWRVCVTIMILGFGFRGLVCFGHTANPMDISHHFSGTVFGFVNGIGCISGFITPIVTAYFTEDNPKDPTNWQKMFFTATGLYSLAIITFLIFAKYKPLKFDQKGNSSITDTELVKIS